MTAADPGQLICPACDSPYAIVLGDGTNFCPACRHEWKPGDVTPKPRAADTFVDSPAEVDYPVVGADGGDIYQSIVEVTYDDKAAGVERTDRYTYTARRPYTAYDARIAAAEFYERIGDNKVLSTQVTYSMPALVEPESSPDPDEERIDARVVDAGVDAALAAIDDETADELGEMIAANNAAADAYLESLIGVAVTLEGGQRATLLEFPDDDHAVVQLNDGQVVTVDFNSIVSADQHPELDKVVEVELDDETAVMLGDAVLTMACLVVEAGLASIEGEAPDQRLIEPPSGWIPEDVDAIPLMEQAAAVAVAMLIQTFALPRGVIASAVEAIRPATRAADNGKGDQ